MVTIAEQIELILKEELKRDKDGLYFICRHVEEFTPEHFDGMFYDYIEFGGVELKDVDLIWGKILLIVDILNSLKGAELEAFLDNDIDMELLDRLDSYHVERSKSNLILSMNKYSENKTDWY